MRRCYFLKVELLGSCTNKLFIGGINIRNISTKPWSNLMNYSIIQKFLLDCSIFVPVIEFHLLLFYSTYGMSIH